MGFLLIENLKPSPSPEERENIDPVPTLSTRTSMSSPFGKSSTLRYAKNSLGSPLEASRIRRQVEAVLLAHSDVPDAGETIFSWREVFGSQKSLDA
jgi:hypothetical protein